MKLMFARRDCHWPDSGSLGFVRCATQFRPGTPPEIVCDEAGETVESQKPVPVRHVDRTKRRAPIVATIAHVRLLPVTK